MSGRLIEAPYHPWKDTRIGVPPQRHELILSHEKITKALLSFTFDMHDGFGTKLDPDQPILINDKPVPNMDLPTNRRSKSLEFVQRNDIQVTSLLKTGRKGEKNIIEVNYLCSPLANAKLTIPNARIGTLSMEIIVFYPSEVVVHDQVKFKHCMRDGKSIPRDAVVCPYCGHSPYEGGLHAKKCNNCSHSNPDQAEYCEECGAKQAEQKASKLCVNCYRSLSAEASFCESCGTRQPEIDVGKNESKTFCVSCSNPLTAGSRYCAKCGFQQP